MEASTFLFQFRLLPWSACVNFNFDNVPMPERFVAVCTRDLLGLQVVTSPENFDTIYATAENLATALVNAHAYFSFPYGPALDVEPMNSFEVKDTGAKPTVFGYADKSLLFTRLEPEHPDNRDFFQAAKLLPFVHDNAALGAALADFRTARREISDYAGFYAYRVLEDIAYSFGAELEKRIWDAMNQALGTTEEHWKELTQTGTNARHLSPGSRGYLLQETRNKSLRSAKDALDRWLTYLKIVSVEARSSAPP